jgi:hypothetical protein
MAKVEYRVPAENTYRVADGSDGALHVKVVDGASGSALAPITVAALLAAALVTGAGSGVAGVAKTKTFTAYGTTGSGAGAATITIEGSVDGTHWDATPIGTINLTLGTTASSDSFTSNDRYAFVRAHVTAISGTGASVTVKMGS